MTPSYRPLVRIAQAFAAGLLMAVPAVAQDAETRLTETIARIETDLDAKVGLVIQDSASDWSVSHRADEPVLMNSTFKAMLCAAVLQQAETGALTLDEALPIATGDILEYAPVTEPRAGGSMTVGDLCFAAIDMSDNTATNLLIARLGGPEAVTGIWRDLGDPVSRLDRPEPELNDAGPTGQEDTSTPAAMAAALDTVLLGDALSPESRAQLLAWMTPGGVTQDLLRASLPDDWQVADKSGSGASSRNLVAMVTPPGADPLFVSIFVAEAEADFQTRNAALMDLSADIGALLQAR